MAAFDRRVVVNIYQYCRINKDIQSVGVTYHLDFKGIDVW